MWHTVCHEKPDHVERSFDLHWLIFAFLTGSASVSGALGTLVYAQLIVKETKTTATAAKPCKQNVYCQELNGADH